MQTVSRKTDLQHNLFEIHAEPLKASFAPEAFAISLLALSSVHSLGTKGIRAISDALRGDLSLIWKLSIDDLKNLLSIIGIASGNKIAAAIINEREKLVGTAFDELAELKNNCVTVVSRNSLPQKLSDLPDAPEWLFVEGNVDILHSRPIIAVVGTRNPSSFGISAARRVISILAAYPITIVSGLAEGIDAIVHVSSLKEKLPNIAFLGHGINIVFPAATADLRRGIVGQGGAIASDYLPKDHYKRVTFVERNRLQAGIADLVIPIEAGSKSGTAHTFNYARRYGRPVVGIKAPTNSRTLADDIQQEGYPVIDINSSEGCSFLDASVRDMVLIHGHKANSLSRVRKMIKAEMLLRNIRSQDITELIGWLKEKAGECDIE